MSGSPLNPPLAPDETIWRFSGGKWEAISPFTPVEQLAIRALIREELAAFRIQLDDDLATTLDLVTPSGRDEHHVIAGRATEDNHQQARPTHSADPIVGENVGSG